MPPADSPAELPPWAHGSAELPMWCQRAAQHATVLLTGPMSLEATLLSAQGFVVPAPEALERAARVFDSVGQAPGAVHFSQPASLEQRIGAICALAAAVEGLQEEIGVDALSSWWRWCDGNSTIESAGAVLAMVNAGQSERVQALLAQDMQRADRDFGDNR